MTKEDDKLIRKREVAARLGVSKRTLDRWQKQGVVQLKPMKVGGLTLYEITDVEAQVQALATGAAANA